MLPLYLLSSECVVLPLDMDVLWACRQRFKKRSIVLEGTQVLIVVYDCLM